MIELPVVTGMYLKTSSQIGLTMYIEAGKRTHRNIANWLLSLSHSQENVRCLMGYIVNLTVILDAIFGAAAGNVTEIATRRAMDNHVRSGRRNSIDQDIRSFVTETFSIRSAIPEKDLVLEKIISLIRRYCSPQNT